jgi:hypothetical protein
VHLAEDYILITLPQLMNALRRYLRIGNDQAEPDREHGSQGDGGGLFISKSAHAATYHRYFTHLAADYRRSEALLGVQNKE